MMKLPLTTQATSSFKNAKTSRLLGNDCLLTLISFHVLITHTLFQNCLSQDNPPNFKIFDSRNCTDSS